jgi:hypothetical protein
MSSVMSNGLIRNEILPDCWFGILGKPVGLLLQDWPLYVFGKVSHEQQSNWAWKIKISNNKQCSMCIDGYRLLSVMLMRLNLSVNRLWAMKDRYTGFLNTGNLYAVFSFWWMYYRYYSTGITFPYLCSPLHATYSLSDATSQSNVSHWPILSSCVLLLTHVWHKCWHNNVTSQQECHAVLKCQVFHCWATTCFIPLKVKKCFQFRYNGQVHNSCCSSS